MSVIHKVQFSGCSGQKSLPYIVLSVTWPLSWLQRLVTGRHLIAAFNNLSRLITGNYLSQGCCIILNAKRSVTSKSACQYY